MKGDYVKSYGEASVRQQNWENGRPAGRDLTPVEEARKQLKAELYSLKHEYPEAGYDKLYKQLYQFGWVEEMDKVFEYLDVVVDEIVSEELNDNG